VSCAAATVAIAVFFGRGAAGVANVEASFFRVYIDMIPIFGSYLEVYIAIFTCMHEYRLFVVFNSFLANKLSKICAYKVYEYTSTKRYTKT
jgi:hypothetical protein